MQAESGWVNRTNTQSVNITSPNNFGMKRHIYSTHPDLLGVDTCGQKRHTRYPVKLNYLSGATDSKELLQDWELVLCDVSSNTSQRTSSQSSHNWNEPMKHSSHWSPQILGTLPLDKIRDMSLRHLCTQRNTRANVAALLGYKNRRAFGLSRRLQVHTTSSWQASFCLVSCLLFVLAAFCCRKSSDVASLPCRSNRWLWIGAPQLFQLRFKDSQSAGVGSWRLLNGILWRRIPSRTPVSSGLRSTKAFFKWNITPTHPDPFDTCARNKMESQTFDIGAEVWTKSLQRFSSHFGTNVETLRLQQFLAAFQMQRNVIRIVMTTLTEQDDRRMQKISLAVRRDTQEIQAWLNYLNGCNERMQQVGLKRRVTEFTSVVDNAWRWTNLVRSEWFFCPLEQRAKDHSDRTRW